MHGYRPGRVELWCYSFKKKVFFLNLIFVFVYSFCCVYSFNFCIFCIVRIQGSSRQGSPPPPPPLPLVPVGWGGEVDSLSYTSLHPPHVLGHTSPGVGRGWEGFREVIVPGSLPPPHRGFPFPAFFFFLLYIVIFQG